MTAIALPNLSVRALSRLTGLDRDRLSRIIADAKPAGTRSGHPLYALGDVLRLLCRPTAVGESGEIDPDRLSPSDRRAWFDSEAKRRELQIRDRELIPTAEVQQAVSTAFAAIASELRGIPDNLERRGDATPEQAERIAQAIDAAMEGLSDRLAALCPNTGR